MLLSGKVNAYYVQVLGTISRTEKVNKIVGYAYSIQLNDNKHLHSFLNNFILNRICAHAYPQYSILVHVGTLRGQRCHVTLKLELQAIVKHPRQVLGSLPQWS